MKIKYTGLSDTRSISASDLRSRGFESEVDLVWTKGSTLEVDDALGDFLVEIDRDLKNPDATTRDLRTDDEIAQVAQDLAVKGRSKMSANELRAAVLEIEASLVEQPEGDESTSDQGTGSETPQAS